MRPPERVAVKAQHREEGQRELAVPSPARSVREPLGSRESGGRALRGLRGLDRTREQREHDEQGRHERRAEAPGRGSRPLHVAALARQEEAGGLDHPRTTAKAKPVRRRSCSGSGDEFLSHLKPTTPVASSARIAAHSASTAATSRTAVVPKLNSRNAAAKHQRIAAVTAESEVERPPNSSNVSAPEPNTRSTTTNSAAPATTATTNEIRVRQSQRGALDAGDARRRGPLARQEPGHQGPRPPPRRRAAASPGSPRTRRSARPRAGGGDARSATRTSRTTRRTRAPSPQP